MKKNTFLQDCRAPLDKINRTWLRGLLLIGLIPVMVIGGMIVGVVDVFYEMYKDYFAGRIELKAEIQKDECIEALSHCLMIFQSQADRGLYPLELMEGKPEFLGKKGWKFITNALKNKSI